MLKNDCGEFDLINFLYGLQKPYYTLVSNSDLQYAYSIEKKIDMKFYVEK